MKAPPRGAKSVAGAEPPLSATAVRAASTRPGLHPGVLRGHSVSGPAGGYLYRCEALGRGVRQSNGGWT
ncbi:hypothetical protein L1I79_35285 [Strepomyces sp. STD 3.1]|uniref:hypothetical protein n=1 Tax=Streptomyces sp. NPDC058985 TaxID=3346684 RepID=UPI001F3E52E7|nr:hypothetical protein [Streptomyces sp. STD 3.1]